MLPKYTVYIGPKAPPSFWPNYIVDEGVGGIGDSINPIVAAH